MSSCKLEGVEGTSPTLGNQVSEFYLTTENIEQTVHQFSFARFITIVKHTYRQTHIFLFEQLSKGYLLKVAKMQSKMKASKLHQHKGS